jgi:hypothetical protein
MEDLRFPVGRFAAEEFSPEACGRWVDAIAAMPEKLERSVAGLTEAQLDTPYRPEGWTVRQLVHHVADSHMNAFVRFRLALTEDMPIVKTYSQERWADLPDARTAPAEASLRLIRPLHERWTLLLRALTPDHFRRSMQHPELGAINLGFLLQLYAWHGRHHVAHIEGLRHRMKW